MAKRPELREALALAKAEKATLLIAKLDRLARNVHFISGLMESSVSFVALDMPDANRFTVHIMAAVAEHERAMISERTRAALQAAKARGKRLGVSGRDNVAPHNALRARSAQEEAEAMRELLHTMTLDNATLRNMGSRLAAAGHRPLGGGAWHPAQVARILRRLELRC
jgi:DNA invertase Pin-like site-specific DNA recombinase